LLYCREATSLIMRSGAAFPSREGADAAFHYATGAAMPRR
jgi:hypothetical protein